MRTRKFSVLTMTAVALGLALTACNDDGGDNASSSASHSPAATRSTPQSDTKCTDQLNYADDPRSNAEINSIGEDTGTCPPVKRK